MTDPDRLLSAITQHITRLGAAGATALSRVRIQAGDVVVEAVWEPGGEGPPSPAPEEASEVPEGGYSVHAPAVGTFYRSPEPGAPPFVNVGDVVTEGQQLAILEAMKLMNPIEAEGPGRVTRILVADTSPVEYGQPLFVLEPC